MGQDMNQPSYTEWYLCIQDALFGKGNNINLTTFLQTFFSPVLYCDEILTAYDKMNGIQTTEEIEKVFYDTFPLQKLRNELTQRVRRGRTLNTIRSIIINELSNIIQERDDIWTTIDDGCDDCGHLNKAKNSYYYRKNRIFYHYRNY